MTFQQEIKEVFKNHDIELDDNQIEKFYNYFNLIVLWNKKFNLTTITEQSDVIVKHFLDSVLPHKEIKENARVIDIGTGAGFPGIPLKILRDDIDLVLVDALQKRTVFLKEVVETLQLENVLVVHDRSELLGQNASYRESFDVCVSRAVAPLNILLEYCAPFVSVFGLIIAYKAKNTELEIVEAENALSVLGLKMLKTETVTINEISAMRTFVYVKKGNKTPAMYPRGQNKPKTNPL